MNQVGNSPQVAAVTRTRWLEIIAYLANGLRVQEVAAIRGKSLTGTKTDLRRIREYFGAATTLEAILRARREWNLDL
jgi:DNA-binding CsgD family transcriptional regulator